MKMWSIILILFVVSVLSSQSITFQGQVDAGPANLAYWMFDSLDNTPYVHNWSDADCGRWFCFGLGYSNDCGAYAYNEIWWNATGEDNRECCLSGVQGSGQISFGNCTAEDLVCQNGIANVTVEFTDYVLTSVDRLNWGIPGATGDRRTYTGGHGCIKVNGTTKLTAINGQITFDVMYPDPAGPGDSVTGGGFADIDFNPANSDPVWAAEFNNGNGQIEFNFGSVSPVVQNCWGCLAYTLSLTSNPEEEDQQVVNIAGLGPIALNTANIDLDINSYTNQGGVNYFTATRTMANPGGALPGGITAISNYCYWNLGTVLSDLNADVTFDLTGMPGIDTPANLRILHRETSTHPWTVWADYTVVDGTHIRANNVTDFSEWGIGSVSDNPLPVTLSSFTTAITPENFVSLRWVTQSETDMLGYNVFRSDSEELGNAIQVTESPILSNQSAQQNHYSFTDTDVIPMNQYHYWIEAMELDGSVQFYGPALAYVVPTSDPGDTPPIVYETCLKSVHPNPFNPMTTVAFSLRESIPVSIDIFNVRGQRVRSVLLNNLSAGEHTWEWTGSDDHANQVATGVYLLSFRAGNTIETRRMTMLK